ncbi:MAG: hypothetical protein AAF732_01110 [Pseudomonadota bacterium]
MMYEFLRLGRAAVIAVVLAVPLLHSGAMHAAPLACIADWSRASRVVAKERLAPVSQLSRAAREKRVGHVLTATLCSDRGRFVYRVLLRRAGGRIQSVTVDARTPFAR